MQLTAVTASDALPADPEPAEDTSADLLKHLTEAEQAGVRPRRPGPSQENREIAGELFITVSTVEQHLTRIYRKLNVKGRQDLPVEQTGAHPEPSCPRPLPDCARYDRGRS